MARLDLLFRKEKTHLTVQVTVSRRNLFALLHKLDMPGSARTLVNGDCWVNGEETELATLILCCEEDDEHYARRGDPPGPMHPKTEAFIRERISAMTGRAAFVPGSPTARMPANPDLKEERPLPDEPVDDRVPVVAIGAGERAPWADMPPYCPQCGAGPLELGHSEPPGLTFISHCGKSWACGQPDFEVLFRRTR